MAWEQGCKALGDKPESGNEGTSRDWRGLALAYLPGGGQVIEAAPKQDPRGPQNSTGGCQVWRGLCLCFSCQGKGRGEQILSCKRGLSFPRR